jgi:hypothetical protein
MRLWIQLGQPIGLPGTRPVRLATSEAARVCKGAGEAIAMFNKAIKNVVQQVDSLNQQ